MSSTLNCHSLFFPIDPVSILAEKTVTLEVCLIDRVSQGAIKDEGQSGSLEGQTPRRARQPYYSKVKDRKSPLLVPVAGSSTSPFRVRAVQRQP